MPDSDLSLDCSGCDASPTESHVIMVEYNGVSSILMLTIASQQRASVERVRSLSSVRRACLGSSRAVTAHPGDGQFSQSKRSGMTFSTVSNHTQSTRRSSTPRACFSVRRPPPACGTRARRKPSPDTVRTRRSRRPAIPSALTAPSRPGRWSPIRQL